MFSLDAKLWNVLYRLAMVGAIKHPIAMNTISLGKALGVSQQTASRMLIELEKLGLVKREVFRRGQMLVLTEKGVEALKEVYKELKKLFEVEVGMLSIKGEVFTGLGEGAYYVSLEGYRRQFISKLGFDPHPGTLNIKLKGIESLKARDTLDYFKGVEVEGFSDGGRTFGPAKCFKATINGMVEGALVIAMRTHYGRDVVEFIAPINIRRFLDLKDGDLIKADIYLT